MTGATVRSSLIGFTGVCYQVCVSQLPCTTQQAQRGTAQRQARQDHSMPQRSSAQHSTASHSKNSAQHEVPQLFPIALFLEASGLSLGKAGRVFLQKVISIFCCSWLHCNSSEQSRLNFSHSKTSEVAELQSKVLNGHAYPHASCPDRQGLLTVGTLKQKRSYRLGERLLVLKPTHEGCLGVSQHPQGQPRGWQHPRRGLLVIPKGQRANLRSFGKICWLQ